jgi:hypothetical protein
VSFNQVDKLGEEVPVQRDPMCKAADEIIHKAREK